MLIAPYLETKMRSPRGCARRFGPRAGLAFWFHLSGRGERNVAAASRRPRTNHPAAPPNIARPIPRPRDMKPLLARPCWCRKAPVWACQPK